MRAERSPPYRVLFRADASSEIGMGHVARCRTLAREMKVRDIEAHFCSLFLPGDIARGLDEEGLTTHMQEGAGRDPATTAALACALGARLVVLDSYTIDASYCATLKEAGCRILYIDDLGLAPSICDGVLNTNIYAEDLPRETLPDQQLLGPRYALVNASFREARKMRWRAASRPSRPPRILVTMGGADVHGFASTALRDLELLGQEAEIKVTVGAASLQRSFIEAAAARLSARVTILEGVTDLSSAMEWCDIAVTAAGTTCQELACVGTPFVVVALADNQRRIEQSFAQRNLAVGLGWYEDVSAGCLARAVIDLLATPERMARMSSSLRELVDGRGAARVVDWITSHVLAPASATAP